MVPHHACREVTTRDARGTGGGGATPRVLGRQLPPPPLGAFSQQLVPKGVALRRAEGAGCYMNTKGARRKFLSNLHPNTILKPNFESNTHPQSSAYSYPYT